MLPTASEQGSPQQHSSAPRPTPSCRAGGALRWWKAAARPPAAQLSRAPTKAPPPARGSAGRQGAVGGRERSSGSGSVWRRQAPSGGGGGGLAGLTCSFSRRRFGLKYVCVAPARAGKACSQVQPHVGPRAKKSPVSPRARVLSHQECLHRVVAWMHGWKTLLAGPCERQGAAKRTPAAPGKPAERVGWPAALP